MGREDVQGGERHILIMKFYFSSKSLWLEIQNTIQNKSKILLTTDYFSISWYHQLLPTERSKLYF